MFMMEDLVGHREVPITRNMVPLIEIRSALRALPRNRLSDFVRERTESQRATWPPLANAVEARLKDAEAIDDLVDEVIHALVVFDNFPILVASPHGSVAYASRRWIWHAGWPEHVQQSLATGRFLFPSVARPSLTAVVEGQPLFMSIDALRRLQSLRRPSQAELRRCATLLVDELVAANVAPGHRKAQFKARLMAQCPGCTRSDVTSMWSTVVPVDWRKSGRPRRTV